MAESVTYITDAELLQFGLPDDALSAVHVSVRDKARKGASDTASSYLKKRFTLPLLLWGDDIKRAVAHLASLDLLDVRGYDPESESGKRIVERGNLATLWLRDVARGIVEPIDVIDSTPEVDEQAPLVSSDAGAGWLLPTVAAEEET